MTQLVSQMLQQPEVLRTDWACAEGLSQFTAAYIMMRKAGAVCDLFQMLSKKTCHIMKCSHSGSVKRCRSPAATTVLVQTELWLKLSLQISVISGEKVFYTRSCSVFERQNRTKNKPSAQIKEHLCSPVCWPDHRRVAGEQTPWSSVTLHRRKLNSH